MILCECPYCDKLTGLDLMKPETDEFEKVVCDVRKEDTDAG